MTPAATATTTTTAHVASVISTNPNALLDSLDAYASSRSTEATATAVVAANSGGLANKQDDSIKVTSTPAVGTIPALDPIEFLNRHYTTESQLVTQLPSLRTAVSERAERLDERISNALQRQSETADATRRHVQEAKASVASLEKRIRLVQAKASQSERAVLEITKEMKRLDCAKRHLQRTITTLKRLHMLVHAVERLRLACLLKPFPDYESASHLIDATRLLLKHFEAYTHRIEPMRLMGQKVSDIQHELRTSLRRGFRVVGFGLVKALEMEEMEDGGSSTRKKLNTTPAVTSDMSTSLLPQSSLDSGLDSGGSEHDVDGGQEQTLPVMTSDVMSDATLLLDAFGMETRTEFVNGFCTDHLVAYRNLFAPTNKAKAMAANKATSFKLSDSSVDENNSSHEKQAYCLDQMDRRFAWFRRLIRDIDDKFPKVFPPYWNIHYALTRHFLEETNVHIVALLDGPSKDRDANNATILLKALQKTILFEKEMTAWLQRDYGTVFLVPSIEGNRDNASTTDNQVRGDDGEVLEFDESGKAVAANSAEGIRIKYERQKKEQQKQGSDDVGSVLDEGRAPAEQVPVDPLMGIGSSAFDNFMSPYIELESQSMDEQLVESTTDNGVDTRGELPVLTSSTALFVYIKGSITRCTALTKGKAFLLLYGAFKDALQKYAQVLSGKLPNPTTAVGGLTISASFIKQEGGTAATYKIPPGGEATVCHVISTCEYCADTIEALEDLIRDTIDEDYKSQIDMSGTQEIFHDVTAKSIRVLVSGLESRNENAFKSMALTNWASFSVVGEESSYVRFMHNEIQPFVVSIRSLMPSSYFRSFCDKFATAFASAYYDSVIRQKRISEAGTQQLLLDVYNLKTLLLKLPVMEKGTTPSSPGKKASTTIAPAMYTKMVTKMFKRIESLLKLVGTPQELLIDVFATQWVGGTALDLQTVMTLKGMKRNEQASMLEKFGVDPVAALKGATAGVSGSTIMNEHVQALQEKSSDMAAKVNSDLTQMRAKVDDFRRAFR